MYNMTKNEITFPHIIPGNKLGGKEYGFNDINGGMTPIANLDLVQNSFFGGNVRQLGLIKELGLYACPAFWGKQIIGFYIHDPSSLTDIAKDHLEDRFPGITICYQVDTPAEKTLTKEEQEEKERLKKEALDKGLAAETITHTTVDELKSLIDAFDSGEVPDASKLVKAVEDGATQSYSQSVSQAKPRQKGRSPRVKTK